ncbi:MAG: DUF134 domain-containing protein [Candidatus Altiarchaeota archaeon]|nr:DUF134 domain-containing protein [Candidatus Altiarchaeota archaeon]
MRIFIVATSKLVVRGRFGRGRGRPKIARAVSAELGATYFKPAGVPMAELESVVLTMEEAEAIKLIDLEGLEQEEAAERMGVSRKTFWRELQSARKKIAEALVNGKAIRIEGGTYEMVGRGRMGGYGNGPGGNCVCTSCGYSEPHNRGMPCYQKTCPKCGKPMTRP